MLIRQFLAESVFTSVIAMVVAFLAVNLLLDFFSQASGKNYFLGDLYRLEFLFGAVAISLFVGILAGLYPSFYLSSHQPAMIMKAGRGSSRGNSRFRSLLVIFQFFISTTLIIGTMVVYSQLRFFQQKNLGFEKDQVLIIHGVDKLADQFDVLRDNLLRKEQVKRVSGTAWMPGGVFYNWGVTPEGWDGNNFTTLNMILCDTAFLKTMEMEMAYGRFFSPEYVTDTTAIIINEEAAKILNWEDPVGKKISIWGRFDYQVIGVIKDFHYESMHTSVRPMGLVAYPFNPGGARYPTLAAVKTGGGDPGEIIRNIQEEWNKIAHGLPFSYSFLDEAYKDQYENEMRTGNIFMLYSILAVIIASMGLFALSSYIIEQRTREIGIRKVNGATSGNIVMLLTGEFTRWVLAAIILAIPTGYWLMNHWLDNFAYKTGLNIWIFVAAALIGLLIAAFTISVQTIRASQRNPATSLRYE